MMFMTTRGRLPWRASAKCWPTLLLLAALGACEDGAGAVEVVRELGAARGGCTLEGLRASNEECVQAMERYAGMTADLIDTYIGGVRTLDMALERMPPMHFDTAGLGYALSPEYRLGDPAGVGANPRLEWRSTSLNRSSARQSTLRPGKARASHSRPARSRRGPFGFDAYRGWPLSGSRFERGFRGEHGWRGRPGRDAFGPGYHGRGWLPAYDFDRYLDRYSDRYDPHWFEWRSSPYALNGYGAFDGWYGYGGFGGDRYGWFGYDPYDYGIYPPDPYGYGPYGYAPYGYAPYGYSEPGYDPRPGADPYDDGFGYREDYAESYDRRYDDITGEEVRTPAEDWAYLPEGRGTDTSTPQDERVSAPAAAPGRPAPHRPGFLLPPEERLRRPWIED